ncbi:symbiotic chitinase [Microsporum canis CBS 113480]|uniref:chitinase n=1 Tax=Arthroderma otae (strain ATCC MYA-4605 / CBS 113480) TaxID=554155 RepID=C5FFN4_ARTOC|nr:symbiotic chitinase [Microsporum canis CBS 113480]EEQ29481.1 symbiotic chitinase [Microsporum canis CBS 113480]
MSIGLRLKGRMRDFCGTTEEFCGKGCTSGCGTVKRPSCSGGTSATKRYVGYFEGWNYEHPCDTIHPSKINYKPWTHLNYAFATINPDHTLGTMGYYDEEFYRAFTNLKTKKPSLKCFLSVGGWDAGGRVFSVMANSADSRKVFIESVVKTLEEFGFDGLDVDWEYPVAEDRGYLRGFDLKNMAKYVDWFNVMSYDIHGTWDGHSAWTKEVINPHTNLTEISYGLDLLWRNSVPSEKVLLGLGFYGRSFTLGDPRCNIPGCSFKRTGNENSGGARPGRCTLNSGTLSNYEINRILKSKSPELVYNDEAGVNWITWENDQWVSFDDSRTLKQKASFANNLCLGGTFAWALDLGGPGTMGRPDELNGNTLSLDGADLEGGDSGSGDVYISPEIYTVQNPGIACIPPCTFIMPRLTLDKVTTITFPLYTTSLEVLWWTAQAITLPGGAISSSIGSMRTIQTTTITIPPLITSVLDMWHWPVTETDLSSTTYVVVSSILPPPFMITNSLPSDAVAPPRNTGAGGSQPMNGGQPTQGGGQPTQGGGQPTNGGGQPTQGGGQPTNGGGQPTQGGGQPTNGGGQPTNDGGQPTQGGGQPTNGGGQPTQGGGQPTNGDSLPSPGLAPAISNTRALSSPESSVVGGYTSDRQATQPYTSDRSTSGALPPPTQSKTTASPGDRQNAPSKTGRTSDEPTTRDFPSQTSNKDIDNHNTQPTSNRQSDSSSMGGIILPPGSKGPHESGLISSPLPGSRMFTPKPHPLSGETDNGKLPTVSFTSGPPNPTCTKDCGKKCQGAFCDCKGDGCNNHGKDFIDPNDPNPPKDRDRRTCFGPECKDGKCELGLLCSNFDCVGPDCHDGICVGINCARIPCGKSCKNGFCEGPDCTQDTDECEKPEAAPRCTESVTKYKRSDSVYSSTTTTECSTVTACSVEETTFTTTTTIDNGEIITVTEHYPIQPLLSDDEYKSIASKLHRLRTSRDKSRFGATFTTEDLPTHTVTMTIPTYTYAHEQDKGKLSCKHTVGVANRKELIRGISFFCQKFDRQTFNGDQEGFTYLNSYSPVAVIRGDCGSGKCKSYVRFGVKVKRNNKCQEDFVFNGRGNGDDQCGQNFRQIVDRCNTRGENGKRSGSFAVGCLEWYIDVIANGSWEADLELRSKELSALHTTLQTDSAYLVYTGVAGEPTGTVP